MKDCCRPADAPKSRFRRLFNLITTAIILLLLGGGLLLTLIRLLHD